MVAKVRAKFQVRQATKEGADNRITLDAVISGSPENESFFNATPGGTIDLFVVSGETAKFFKEGQEFYVDFTPAG